jgi:hypothetical protein
MNSIQNHHIHEIHFAKPPIFLGGADAMGPPTSVVDSFATPPVLVAWQGKGTPPTLCHYM